MDKKYRKLLSTIAHEAHMMGRVYHSLGEKETPSEVYGRIEDMIENKLKHFTKKRRQTMICIYHKSDLDGQCSAAIVKFRYPDCEVIGMDYSNKFPWYKIFSDQIVFMVDFHLQPFEDMVRLAKSCKFTWIDHHESAVEDYKKTKKYLEIDMVLDLKFAACELTWKYLFPNLETPLAVELLGRYDVWDHSNEMTLPFQYGMRLYNTHPESQKFWNGIFGKTWSPEIIAGIIKEGQTVLKYINQYNTKYAELAFEVEFDGLKCIAINKLLANSQLFDSIWDKTKYHAMVAFGRRKKDLWLVSMYSDREDVDVSKIASRWGGGGHKGAAGFHTKVLPWEE